MDPLSDVLSLLKPRTFMAGGFDVGSPFSVRFERHEGIKCYAIVSGECWLVVEGVPEPVRLRTGDCFLLPRGAPFYLGTDLSTPPVDAHTLMQSPVNGQIRVFNGGGDCLSVGAYFSFEAHHAEILLGVLPPIVHLRKESDKTALRSSLERMRQELCNPQPGSSLLVQHIAHALLVQALRLYLAEGPQHVPGWLYALSDPQMSAAIHAIHEQPAHPWTVESLAHRAGMSRSIFAARFKETVGKPPMEYLSQWRMLLAADRLTHSADAVAAIALAFGYESESSFSTAFKRIMGCSPRQYARGCRPAPIAQFNPGIVQDAAQQSIAG
jgi:AraC-like DNA-binding protein